MSIWGELLGTAAETAGAAASGPIAPVATAVSDVSHLAENVIERIFGETESKTLDREQARQIILDGFDQARLMGQIEINKVEAASASVFVAGWRPAIGWVCALGLFWQYFLMRFVNYLLVLFSPDTKLPPDVDMSQLLTLLLAMMGMVAARSIDKDRGTARDRL